MLSSGPDRNASTVAAYLAAQPARARLESLRSLILRVALNTPGVGALTETLKWGEPSYAPARPRIGSSVRLAARPNGDVAMHFICHTGLVDRFREIYPDALAYEGNRTILIRNGTEPDVAALSHCIAMALTYHLAKKAG